MSAAMVERIPLTKRPESSVEYVLASSTASSMTTATGGPVGIEQLGDRQAEHQAVDDRHAVERPTDRGGRRCGDRPRPGGDGPLTSVRTYAIGRDGELVDDRERGSRP